MLPNDTEGGDRCHRFTMAVCVYDLVFSTIYRVKLNSQPLEIRPATPIKRAWFTYAEPSFLDR